MTLVLSVMGTLSLLHFGPLCILTLCSSLVITLLSCISCLLVYWLISTYSVCLLLELPATGSSFPLGAHVAAVPVSKCTQPLSALGSWLTDLVGGVSACDPLEQPWLCLAGCIAEEFVRGLGRRPTFIQYGIMCRPCSRLLQAGRAS